MMKAPRRYSTGDNTEEDSVLGLPEIVIVGAQKAATTSLHRWLIGHPKIGPPIDPESDSPQKEVNFFTNNWERGVAWYEKQFRSDLKGIDSSPNYLSDTRAHARLRSILPNAKLIVSLRNPIDRAYSQYNHYKQSMPDSSDYDWIHPDGEFDKNIRAEAEALSDDPEQFRGFIARGLYALQLQSLLQHFPRDQVHVTIVERWNQRPSPLGELLSFLGLDECYDIVPVAHKRAYTVEAMLPATRLYLAGLFSSYNEQLFELLGYRVSEWE